MTALRTFTRQQDTDDFPLLSLSAATNAGDQVVTLKGPVPTGLASRAALLALDPGSTSCELRRVSAVNGRQITLDQTLALAHSASRYVVWLPDSVVPVSLWGAVCDNTTDDTAAWQAAINSACGANSDIRSPWIDGGLKKSKITAPLIALNNCCLRNFYFSADAAFPADGTNGIINATNATRSDSFTASASTDRITLSTAPTWSLQAGKLVIFTGGNLPAPLVAGHVYYVASVISSTVFTLAATQGGAAIDLTSDGSGTLYGAIGSLTRLKMDNGILLGNNVASLHGIVAGFQQPDKQTDIRVDTCPGTGFRLVYSGQAGNFYNCEANSCGLGFELGGSPAFTGAAVSITGYAFYDCHFVGNGSTGNITNSNSIGFFKLWSELPTTRGLYLTGSGANLGLLIEGFFPSHSAGIPAVEIDAATGQYGFEISGCRGPAATFPYVKDNKRSITLNASDLPQQYLIRYSQSADGATSAAPVVVGQSPWQQKSADYTATVADQGLGVDASGAARTITLPSAVGLAGKEYIVKKTDSSGNTVTVAASGGQNFEGASTIVLSTQWAYTRVVSNGANWRIIT